VLKRDEVKRKVGKTAFLKALFPLLLNKYFWVIKSRKT